jgi:hypothetical protein
MTKKTKAAKEDSIDQSFDLFKAIEALDRKDYGYYGRLTTEQQKKFVPFQLIQWMSAVQGKRDLQLYYLHSTEMHANKYLFDHMISSKEHSHPTLQWLMLTAASPGIGKQYHQWIPSISSRVTLLKENAVVSDTQKYFKKIYPHVSEKDISEISEAFVKEQRKKVVLGKIYPNLKLDEIELLSALVTDDDINQYERDSGN